MELNDRIEAFVKLGHFLRQFGPYGEKEATNPLNEIFYSEMNALIESVKLHNPWFTPENVRSSLGAISADLNEKTIEEWLETYSPLLNKTHLPKTVAVIMAGNIPMVGFNDMLCVLMSGNKFLGKLSSEDKLLLPFIAKVLIAIEPRFSDRISFTDGQLKQMDVVIATGSNNSARYFDYYFGKYPHIIRKNRNSIAVLTGSETLLQLEKLADDVFMYFGLGCRSVSKIFVPEGYKFDKFFDAIYKYQSIINNNKYVNNYEYNRTVYLMKNDKSLLDNNFLLLKQDESNASPIGVLFYEFYNNISDLKKKLEGDKDQLQCLVADQLVVENAVPFGYAQCPSLLDYADGVDTMQFLISLN